MSRMDKIGRDSAIAVMLGILSLSWSCGGEKSVDEHAEASGLYKRTCMLTRQYIDSIKSAKDTVTLNALLERYEEMLDRMNFEVEPDTDYQLSEGENDTISMLMDQLAKAREERLKVLRKAPADSVASDTIIR